MTIDVESRTLGALFFLGLLGTPSTGLAQKAFEGFPIRVPGRAAATGLTLVDIDGDGAQEAVFVTGEGFAIAGKDGLWDGFPKILRESTDKTQNNFDHAPTVCDLDGDGDLDIMMAGTNRKLYALESSGEFLDGFPVTLDGEPKGGVACAPIKDNKAHVLVLTTAAGSLLRVSYIGVKPIKLASIGAAAESGVGVSDLDGDGIPEYVVVGGDSRVYTVSDDGKAKGDLQYQMRFRVSGTPSLGDIDDDGELEIVMASQDFKVHAVKLNGKSVEGFPYETGYRLYGAPALADLDRDGVLDVVVGSGDRKVHAVDGKGKAIPGFPVSVDGRLTAEVAVGDLDFDGFPEIAAVTERGSLHVLTSKGEAVRGFPKRLDGERNLTAPAIGDFDGDGAPELLAQSAGGQIHAYAFERRGKAEKAIVDWAMSGHDASGSGRFGPNPGRFKDLSFGATLIRTSDDLKATYQYVNLDGGAEGKTRVRWIRNGKAVAEFDDARTVPANSTRKHEVWKYTLQDELNFDAFGEDGTLSRKFESPELEIANTQPTQPKISLGPENARTSDALVVKITGPSTDPDGDQIQYRYAWVRDGIAQKNLEGLDTVDPSLTLKAQVWRVVVAPFDGEVEGPSQNEVIRVLNTVPTAPQVAWSIEGPKVDDELGVLIKTPSMDADGDPISYRYDYTVGEQGFALPVNANKIPPRTLRKADPLKVVVTAWDTEAAGGSATISTQYKNTPPVAPRFSIWPEKPTTNDALVANINVPQYDADRDKIELVYEWLLNGAPTEMPAIVPSVETAKGQKWTLRITPKDGEVSGAPFEASTVIGNSEPVAPIVSLERYDYRTTEAIVPKIVTPASDSDDDPVSLSYEWFKNEKPSGIRALELPSSATQKGETWELRVTPNDGVENGANSVVKTIIANTPPTAPRVSFRNKAPTVKDSVTVRIEEKSSDVDGDRLAYRYRWFKNDEPLTDLALWKTTLEPEDMKKGERWRVEVTAFDGTDESSAVRAELRVSNHLPTDPSIRIAKALDTKVDEVKEDTGKPKKRVRKKKESALYTTDDLHCEFIAPAIDPDQDPVTYRYRWYRNDQFVPAATELATLPAKMTKKDDSWVCEAQAFDGEGGSKWVRSKAAKIWNTKPSDPALSIFPVNATTTDDLVCQLTQPSTDPDFESISYRATWKVNGKARKDLKGHRVSASLTKKDETWTCSVTASDGSLRSGEVRTEIRVNNTAPTPPLVDLPGPAYADEDVACRVRRASADVDQDKIVYKYRWNKDGVEQSFAETSSSVPGRLVGEKQLWKCQVTASDGVADSAPVESGAILVGPKRKVKKRETRGEKRRRRSRSKKRRRQR